MNGEDKEKKIYEIALLLKSEDDAPRFVAFMKQYNCEIVSEPRAKKLALAYKIKGHTEAVFASCIFKASGEDAKRLEHDLAARQEVIRSMILVSPPPMERDSSATPSFPREKWARPSLGTSPVYEARPAAPHPLSNEALEKKIEELL